MESGEWRPLRVVIDARIPDGLYGGVQQWVLGLAVALSRLDSPTEEYLFLVEHGQGGWLRPHLGDRCRLLVAKTPSVPRRAVSRARHLAGRIRRGMRKAFAQVRGAGRTSSALRLSPSRIPHSDGTIERAAADVIHFTTQSGFLTDVPSIYHPWDLQHLHLPDFFTEEQRAWRELTYRAYCAQAKLVVTASEWIKDDLVTQYGLPSERIDVIAVPPPTAAYPDPTPSETADVAGRLGLPERFVYYPAQTWPHKNHGRLFEALALLREDGLVVPLVCSGHLNERYPEVMETARRLGIASQVRFVGFVEPVEIQVLYRMARAMVFPSLYEGWGLPILEAFSNGLPVACSNATSLPEVAGEAALLFDPSDSRSMADAVRRLWTDDRLGAELAERGRSVARSYDWDRTARIFRARYRMVAGLGVTEEGSSSSSAAQGPCHVAE